MDIVVKNAEIRGKVEDAAAGYHVGQPERHAVVAKVDPAEVADWRPYLQAAMDASRLVELDPSRVYELADLSTYQGVVVRDDRIIEANGARIRLADGAKLPKSIALLTTFKTGSPDAVPVSRVKIRDMIVDLNGEGQADQSITLMALNATGDHWRVDGIEITGARAGSRECFAARIVPQDGLHNTSGIYDSILHSPTDNVEYQSTVDGHIWEISAFSAGTVEGCRVYADVTERQVSRIHGVTPGCRIRPRIVNNHSEGANMRKCVWMQWGATVADSWFVDPEIHGNTHLDTR